MATQDEVPPRSKNLLVFGATGNIGVPIMTALVENISSFDRLAVFTSGSGDAPKKELLDLWKARGVDIIQGNIQDDSDVVGAYQGIDTVISALGRSAILAQLKLIELALHTPSVTRFIPSEFGTDVEHDPSSANEKPHQAKLKVRAALRASKGLDYTFLVTGPYADADSGFYLSAGKANKKFGSFDVETKRAVVIERGEDKVALTTCRDVGKLLYAVLQNPGVSSKKALKVTSFVATPNEIVAEFERQTRAKWEVEYTPLSEVKSLEDQLWAEGSPIAALATLRRIWSSGGTLYDKWDNDVLGDVKVDNLIDAVASAIN